MDSTRRAQGAGLALCVELLAGALSGGAVVGQEVKKEANRGRLFLCVKPDALVDDSTKGRRRLCRQGRGREIRHRLLPKPRRINALPIPTAPVRSRAPRSMGSRSKTHNILKAKWARPSPSASTRRAAGPSPCRPCSVPIKRGPWRRTPPPSDPLNT